MEVKEGIERMAEKTEHPCKMKKEVDGGEVGP